MSYQASRRLHITTKDGDAAAPRVHEDAGDGTPLCGYRRNVGLNTWRGQPLQFMRLGPGDVTCRNCERVA